MIVKGGFVHVAFALIKRITIVTVAAKTGVLDPKTVVTAKTTANAFFFNFFIFSSSFFSF